MTDLNALIKEEHEILGKENPQCSVDSRSTGGAPCSEPFVTFSPDDMTGLAFSGGGIRSATFNLGLLKGLADCGLLGMFDYLSTVSGGGYIGSWWRLWLERERGKKGREAPIFPLSSPDGSEAAEVRRLRQFSNFLAPYLGFFEVETWRLAVALIAGLVPSLLTAVLLVAAVMLGWCSLGGAVFASEAGVGITSLLVLTLLVQAACEAWWLSSESAPPREWWPTFMGALLLGAVSMAFALVVLVGSPWSSVLARGWAPWTPLEPKPKILAAAVLPTCKVALLWLIGALPVLLAPVVLSQEPRRPADALSRFLDLCGRTASRMLGTSLVWLALGMLWHLGQLATSRESWTGVAALLGGAAGTGGLFGLVSKFFDVAHERPNVPVSTLKKYLLMPLSYLAVGLFVAGTAALLIRTHNQLAETVRLPSPAALAAVALGALALLALTVHPQQTSLHEFYRARICRAYLAETNETCGKGLRTDEQKGDDYDLFSVGTPKRAEPNATKSQSEPDVGNEGHRHRPLHLVCTAANDLAGDRMSTLSRGSRSATLSPLGLALGNIFIRAKHVNPSVGLRYSSVVTASAAAFNSQMGGKSVALGAAGTFLMAALNMRLGLWVQVSTEAKGGVWSRVFGAISRLLPGTYLLREMLGLTWAAIPPGGASLHLSDGGHFENLALYELVRRHCRYILLSDCGQDEAVQFEDFGNAQRRIREDFGVEIEIDLEPLIPDANGRSRQHLVCGTIHYDGVKGFDKGILLYFKPTLTGDEPVDITHYHATHASFPHESTGDQFFDEAQWESYRRLGEHAARSAFRFLENAHRARLQRRRGTTARIDKPFGSEALSAFVVFPQTRFTWQPAPPEFRSLVAKANERFTAFMQRVRGQGPTGLVDQLFPEVTGGRPRQEEVGWLDEFLGLAADWVDHGDSGVGGTHPLCSGWRNWIARWTSTPSFREWWPILRPLCPRHVIAHITGLNPLWDRDAERRTRFVLTGQKRLASAETEEELRFRYSLRFADGRRFSLITLTTKVQKEALYWNEDLSKPREDRAYLGNQAYWGSGYGTRFIERLRKHAAKRGLDLLVGISGAVGSDAASRRELADLLAFYQHLGFKLKAAPVDRNDYRELVLPRSFKLPDGSAESGL